MFAKILTKNCVSVLLVFSVASTLVEARYISPFVGYGFNPIASPMYGYGMGLGLGGLGMGYGMGGYGMGMGYPFGLGYGYGFPYMGMGGLGGLGGFGGLGGGGSYMRKEIGMGGWGGAGGLGGLGGKGMMFDDPRLDDLYAKKVSTYGPNTLGTYYSR